MLDAKLVLPLPAPFQSLFVWLKGFKCFLQVIGLAALPWANNRGEGKDAPPQAVNSGCDTQQTKVYKRTTEAYM